MKSGRPKGLKVAMCRCGWRVTTNRKAKSKTCAVCGTRVIFAKPRGKKGA